MRYQITVAGREELRARLLQASRIAEVGGPVMSRWPVRGLVVLYPRARRERYGGED